MWLTLIKHPYKSFNIFKELSIVNLRKAYMRAKKDLEEYLLFFHITDKETAEKVLLEKPPGYEEERIRRQAWKRDDEEPEKDELRVNFEELCYESKVSFSEVHEYITMLLRRIKKIEESIDDHFCMLGPKIRETRTGQIVKQATQTQLNEDRKSNSKTGGSVSQAGGSVTNRSVSATSKGGMSARSRGSRMSKMTGKSKGGRTEEENAWLRERIAKEIRDDL